jgi:hypothetical protein
VSPWIGVVEELCVTLLIGGSIDYCIHLAVAYSEAGETSPGPGPGAGPGRGGAGTSAGGGDGAGGGVGRRAGDWGGVGGEGDSRAGDGGWGGSQAGDGGGGGSGSGNMALGGMRRGDKMRAALRGMAPTLTGAAATTALSSAMLLACQAGAYTRPRFGST